MKYIRSFQSVVPIARKSRFLLLFFFYTTELLVFRNTAVDFCVLIVINESHSTRKFVDL